MNIKVVLLWLATITMCVLAYQIRLNTKQVESLNSQNERVNEEKQRMNDMKHQQWLYEQGLKSDDYGIKPGCDGKGKCGADAANDMNLQQDVKEQYKARE
jgi:hypothetical protein